MILLEDSMKLAIYDFDGTIFEKETLPFIVKYYGANKYSKVKLARFYARILALVGKYKLKLDPNLDKEAFRSQAAKLFMILFEGMTKDQIIDFFAACTTEIVNHFNQDVIDSLHEKKAAGYHTVICSGANTLLLGEVGKHLPVDTIIGTELEFLDDQTYDYDAEPMIVTGVNKPKALLKVFDQEKIDWANSWAYGDSYYDHDILTLTGNPVAVNPDPGLRQIATSKGWTILAN
jgi:HAD superfamily phosphoserine phosphatase-like hydrolase